MVSSRVCWDALNEPQVVNFCRDAVPGDAQLNILDAHNNFANPCRRADQELSNLAGEKRFPAPDIHADFQIFLIVEGHALVFRRLRRKPGTDLIRCDDALGHVEVDRHRESSISEYDSACIATRPVDLVTGVRCVVADVLVPSL